MGKLEVIFRIRLAYPLLRMSASETPAVIQFEKNTVRLEPPKYGLPPDQPALDGFAQLILHVERECSDEQGRDTSDSDADRGSSLHTLCPGCHGCSKALSVCHRYTVHH